MSKSTESPSEATLGRLRAYIHKTQSREYNHTDHLSTRASYDRALEQTLAELEGQLQHEKNRAEELRVGIPQSPVWNLRADDPRDHLRQLQILIGGFSTLAQKEPSLPTPSSQLPVLLAVHETVRIVKETKQQVSHTASSLEKAREDLQAEESTFLDAELLQKALRLRIDSLRVQVTGGGSGERVSDSKTNSELLVIEVEQSRAYEQDQQNLTDLLSRFIRNNLAPLLAAEELGGPITGSALDITEEILASGFNNKGKANRVKSKATEDRRQRRLNEMYGSLEVDEDNENLRTEVSLAAQAMEELLGDLLEAAVDHGSRKYVEVEKETAASRFLVRAKVAVLDPKDARKIRLIDFGKPREGSD